MTPSERILSALQQRNCNPRQSGNGWQACCPAHDDKNPSLSISETDDGCALVHCHAGCDVSNVLTKLGLKLSDLMPESTRKSGRTHSKKKNSPIIAQYDYCDKSGELLFQVVRKDPKVFRQRRPKKGGGWDWSVEGVQIVPFRLPELLGKPGQPVFVVEGEKDVDNLAKLGLLATCNAGGAGKWTHEHAKFLSGRDVIIIADNDEPGKKHAEKVAQSLKDIAESLKVLDLPSLPDKGDVSDWLAAGGTSEELMKLVSNTPTWTHEAEAWQDLSRFDVVDLPRFPSDALPNALRKWVEAESHATQTPVDLAGLLALSVVSTTLARRVLVEPRVGWREPVNLYTAILLEPANRKSAVFEAALKPLRDLESDLIAQARPLVARAQSERRQDEALLRKLEKKAAEKGDPQARYEAGDLAEKLEAEKELVLPRFLIDDATPEKLVIMLSQQGGRIASMSPEGGVFDLMAGKYSRNGSLEIDAYLKGHSGDDLVSDRVSRESVRVEKPALTCAYAIQPIVISGLMSNPAFRGRGLLARFLYALPRSWIGERDIKPTPVPEAVTAAYHTTVRALAETDEEFILKFSAGALELFEEWLAEIEAMLAEGGLMENITDWGGKLAGATLRILAVLHCVKHGLTGTVDEQTISNAIKIAKYLIPHADAVLNMMQAKEGTVESDARYILSWIKRHSKQEFTKRDVHQHGKRRFKKACDIDPALDELINRGYIRSKPIERKGHGRPPSPAYEVNPELYAEDDSKKRSHNSQKKSEQLGTVNIENIEDEEEQIRDEIRIQVII